MEGLSHRQFVAQDYALINPMQVALDQRSDLKTITLLPKGFERHTRMMPLLLDLKSLRESQRLELLDRADKWAGNYDMPLFSALLAGDVDIASLKGHLVRNMLLRKPGAKSVWLRFHDPRVFRHLRWLLDREQMARLMGPITSWTWYDPLSEKWHIHEREAPASFQRVFLTREQWPALEQFEALNRCLRDMAEKARPPIGDEGARQLIVGLVEAQKLGFRDVADRALYAQQRLTHGGEGFSRSAEVRQRLETMNAGKISYVAVCMGAINAPQAQPING